MECITFWFSHCCQHISVPHVNSINWFKQFHFYYLDNVLVFSEMYEDHLHHLNILFEKFQKAGLKIKLSKCQFFKSHII